MADGPSRAVGEGEQSVQDVAPKTRGHIFVSSVEEDRTVTDALILTLEASGHACWAAHRDIVPGAMSWAGAIVEAIIHSNLIVVVVSTSSVTSRQVLREITIADDEGVPFLPFCIDGAALTPDFRYYFSTSQQLRVGHLSESDAINALRDAVNVRMRAV